MTRPLPHIDPARPDSVALALNVPGELVEQIAKRAAAIVAEGTGSKTEPWLTVEKAAAHLGISTSQLYTLASRRRRNGFPLTKEGTRNYFRASELDHWRESGGGR